MKKITFILLLVVNMFFVASVNAQDSRCPTLSRCLTFVGEDTYETQVTISNGAYAILQKFDITIEDEGTLLIWERTCKKDICRQTDLTGRKFGKRVPQNDLNQTLKITAFGKNSVKIQYEEFDGDSGTYYIVNGGDLTTKPPLR